MDSDSSVDEKNYDSDKDPQWMPVTEVRSKSSLCSILYSSVLEYSILRVRSGQVRYGGIHRSVHLAMVLLRPPSSHRPGRRQASHTRILQIGLRLAIAQAQLLSEYMKAEPSPLFVHRARPTPLKCKNEYLVFTLGDETAVQAVVGSIVWYPGSNRLYRLGVSQAQKAKESGYIRKMKIIEKK